MRILGLQGSVSEDIGLHVRFSKIKSVLCEGVLLVLKFFIVVVPADSPECR
jgi:hypothetical protein